MTSENTELDQQIGAYLEQQYQRYLNWYGENAKLAKNNLIAASVVVVACALLLVFFPGPMDEMSFFQHTFDPTNAVKIGLLASVLLALYSMFTSFRQRKRCLDLTVQLQTEFSVFQDRDTTDAGPDDEAAFETFKSSVDAIMAAANPEVVIAVERDNAQKAEASKA